MQRKHAGASRAGVVELREQLLGRERAPVLVEAEMGVGVDHLRISWAQALDFGEKGRKRLGVERVVHPLHHILSSWLGRS